MYHLIARPLGCSNGPPKNPPNGGSQRSPLKLPMDAFQGVPTKPPRSALGGRLDGGQRAPGRRPKGAWTAAKQGPAAFLFFAKIKF